MALKDALFLSDKKPAIDGGERGTMSKTCMTGESPTPGIQSQAASRQTTPVIQSSPGRPPPRQRRDLHGVQKRRVHHGVHQNSATQGDPNGQRRDPQGAQKKRVALWSPGEHPLCSQDRGREAVSDSSTSPYNMDRTARIKAMSSVATQTDSFQDHLGESSEIVHIDSFQDPSYLAAAHDSEEFRKLVHIDSFQDPSHMVIFDFFQDHLEENWKLVQIDSFQDHHSGLYGKSSEIDSFQDPCELSSN